MKRHCLWTLTGLLLCGAVSAPAQKVQLTQLGSSIANFLKIGVGARAVAMGEAFTALSDDASTVYWNPGGLGNLRENQAMFDISNWLLDTRHYSLSSSVNVGEFGVVGASVNFLSSGDIPETTLEEPDGTGRMFTASDLAISLTYSRRITDNFTAGITVKYVSEQLDRSSASTVALDVGSVFVTDFLNNMRIGFALSNLGGQMRFDGTDLSIQYLPQPGFKYVPAQLSTESWDIPLLFRFGVATDVFKSSGFRVTVASDVIDSRDFTYRVNVGGEVGYEEKVFLRGGYKINTDEAKMSLGFGVRLPEVQKIGVSFDYAYMNFGILENVHRISITVKY